MMDTMDDDYDDEDYEDDAARVVAETERVSGEQDRAYFDNLAKENEDHTRTLKADLNRRVALISEMRQNIHRKEEDLRAVEVQIKSEKARTALLERKEYYKAAVAKGIMVDTEVHTTSTRSNEVPGTHDSPFVTQTVFVDINELTRTKEVLEEELKQMKEAMSVAERARATIERKITLL